MLPKKQVNVAPSSPGFMLQIETACNATAPLTRATVTVRTLSDGWLKMAGDADALAFFHPNSFTPKACSQMAGKKCYTEMMPAAIAPMVKNEMSCEPRRAA